MNDGDGCRDGSCPNGCGGLCRRCPGRREAIVLGIVTIAVIGFSYAYYLL